MANASSLNEISSERPSWRGDAGNDMLLSKHYYILAFFYHRLVLSTIVIPMSLLVNPSKVPICLARCLLSSTSVNKQTTITPHTSPLYLCRKPHGACNLSGLKSKMCTFVSTASSWRKLDGHPPSSHLAVSCSFSPDTRAWAAPVFSSVKTPCGTNKAK